MKKQHSPLPPVLYEDDCLIAYDKPSGLLVAPDRWDKELLDLMGLVHKYASEQWANVHRLDRDTSGIVVVAKTPEALQSVQAQFDRQGVRKTYMAITLPAPVIGEGVIESPIGPDDRKPGRMRVSDEHGKEAITEYLVLEKYSSGHALLKVQPRTGRTHQIRVHLAHLGCPVLCDPMYEGGPPLLLSQLKHNYKRSAGDEKPLIERLALHAHEITFAHPATGLPLTIQSPLPREFEVAIKYLRRFAAR